MVGSHKVGQEHTLIQELGRFCFRDPFDLFQLSFRPATMISSGMLSITQLKTHVYAIDSTVW
jgi:hypothetical protein